MSTIVINTTNRKLVISVLDLVIRTAGHEEKISDLLFKTHFVGGEHLGHNGRICATLAPLVRQPGANVYEDSRRSRVWSSMQKLIVINEGDDAYRMKWVCKHLEVTCTGGARQAEVLRRIVAIDPLALHGMYDGIDYFTLEDLLERSGYPEKKN